MLLSYLKRPKMPDWGHVNRQIFAKDLSHGQSLHLLLQSRHSLNTDVPSSADLTCFAIENILLLPNLKLMYSDFSKASCGFSSCRFIFFLT